MPSDPMKTGQQSDQCSEPTRCDMPTCRPSALNVLRDKIERANRHQLGLEVLRKAIPWHLLSRDDELILCDFLMRADF